MQYKPKTYFLSYRQQVVAIKLRTDWMSVNALPGFIGTFQLFIYIRNHDVYHKDMDSSDILPQQNISSRSPKHVMILFFIVVRSIIVLGINAGYLIEYFDVLF